MASVLQAKKKSKRDAGSVAGTHCKPTKIPVWTGYKRGSSSEDSDVKTRRIKSSEMRQSPSASRLPVRIDVVPGSQVDAKDMRTEMRPTSGSELILKHSFTEMKECLSINQARCNEVIEQGLRQILPGIMKELLAQGVGSKDEGLPKKRKQERPRNNRANRRTSAQNIPVSRQTSTHSKLPGKVCVSDSSISGISSITTDSGGLTRSEPESVPQKVQSESEELSDGKEKEQEHEVGIKNCSHSEPLIVPQSVQSDEDVLDELLDFDIESFPKQVLSENDREVSDSHENESVKMDDLLGNECELKHNHNIDSDELFDSDLENFPKQVLSENDQGVSDRQENVPVNMDNLLSTECKLKHDHKNDSDGLSDFDLGSQPKQAQSKNEDGQDKADKAGDVRNDYILRYQPDSSWLSEFDQEIEDLLKKPQGADDQVLSDREDKADKDVCDGEHPSSTYSSLRHNCIESDLESKRESELDEASDGEEKQNNSDYIREYDYDADLDGMTDSEPEAVPNKVQVKSSDEEGEKAGNSNDRKSGARPELSFESDSDNCVNSVHDDLSQPQVQNEKEVLSDEETKAQESSHSPSMQKLECKIEAILDDLASSSSSDPLECNIKSIISNQVEEEEEEGVEPSESGSSLGSKLRRLSVEIETDDLFSTDSEAGRVSKDVELKILSDDGDIMKVSNDDEGTLPSGDEILEDNQSCEEHATPSGPADMTTNDNQPEVELMTRQMEQIIEDLLIKAADETKEKKQEATSCNKTTGTDQVSQSSRGGEGTSTGQVQRGASTKQGSTAGGSGGDDPNDPKKPSKPGKEPEDKKERDEEMERRRAVKRALMNKLMGIASNMLQNKPKGKQPLVKTKTAATNEDKASQTKEEERVETLLKTIQSKDREIVLLQNLIDCCRKDYEELQESFNGYIEEFAEVDKFRDLIRAMYTDNSILRHDNQKIKNQLYHKTDEAEHAHEKNKKYQGRISKMEADINSLKSEKEKLSHKLKSYAATAPREGQKDKQDKEEKESTLGKTCSLQDVEFVKIEEENQALKRKLEQCEDSLKAQKKTNTELKEKLTKQKLAQQQLESKIKKLAEENKTLSSKCIQLQRERSEIPVEEIVKDLRRLQEEISEAKKDLASDNMVEKPELKRPTLRPLSIELAEADDITLQTQPEVNPTAELHTLTYSLTALTEELRENIAQTKDRMAKAHCDDNYEELERRSNEKMRELNEEIAELHGKLDEDTEKFKNLQGLVTSSHTESDRLNEWIAELQTELSNSEVKLNETIAENDKKLEALKNALDLKDQKLEGMMIQHQNLLEANDALRGVIHTLNMNGATSTSKIMELENYLGELENENEKLFKELCEHRTNLHKIQRENEERYAFSSEEVEQLHYALQNKTDSLVDILDTVNQIAAHHPGYRDHPCVSAIENGLQVVYDVTGLLKAVGHTYMPRTEKDLREPLQEETHEQELEIMVENLQEENKKFQDDIRRLQSELKESKTWYGESGLENMGDEVNLVRKSSSEIINELEKELRDRQDSEMELQQKADALRQKFDKLKAEKSEADKKVEQLKTSIGAKQNSLAEQQRKEEQKLTEKLSGMEIAISELQKEKQDAEQKAHDEIKLIRRESLEKVTSLENSLKERSDSETKLEEKVLSLEARIAQLNVEKAEREENIKRMMEALNTNKNLEDHLRQKQDVEKQLVKEVEGLKLKMSRVRAAKKNLRRELEKMHLQHRTNSTGTRNLIQKLKTELAECSEREKELNERVKKLTEDRNKAESIMEAQVTLIKKSSEEKMEDLEELLRMKSQSELELQEQKTSLEQELVRLEKERTEHTRIISAILGAVKAKQELAKAFKDKCKIEKDYKAKFDEIEIVINKLKTEKCKPNCDVGLKEKYKQKYFELRVIVKKLEEDLNSQNKRVEELQTVVLTAVEEEDKSEDARESNLRRSIETLKDTLSTNHACEVELYNTLKSLNSKILFLENEKAEGQKMMKGLLRSMGGRQTSQQAGAAASKIATDKAFLRLIGDVIDAVHNLRQVKQRVEEDLENFEKMVAKARSETEVLQNQYFEIISGLELSLKEKDTSETELKQRVKSMEKRIADLENENHNADMAIQAMLESLKSKEELEKLLNQNEDIENKLKQKVLGLEQEKKQNEMQVKFLQQQVHGLEECLKQNTNLSTAENDTSNYDDKIRDKYKNDFKAKFETLDEASCSCLHKIKNVTQKLQQQNDLEEELKQVIQSLTKERKELQEEKQACMEENRNVVRCLNDLNLELEAANRERQKLSAEVDELKSDTLSSARNSRKLIEKLTRKEKELMKIIEEMEATINTREAHTRSHDERSLNQEMMELKVKIAELENKDYEQNAKNKQQHHELISDSKRAKAKIQDLNLHLKKRMQLEDHLKTDIKALNAKISEMSVQMRNEKMKSVEIEKLYSMSKNRIIELEQRIACKQDQIDYLRKDSEELRGQVVRLQEEKGNLANASEDNYYLKLEQRDMQIKQLKNKLKEQEEKTRESTRLYDDLGQYRGHMFMGESRGNVQDGNHVKENTTKVIIDSLIDTERRISKLKSSWKDFEERQNRSSLNTSIADSINRNTSAYNNSYYWLSN